MPALLAGAPLFVVPAQAEATPVSASACGCAKKVFARHFPHGSFRRWGRHQRPTVRRAVRHIDRKIKRYAHVRATKLAFEGCNADAFVRKVCNAAKTCIVAGAGIFYAEVLNGAGGQRAEHDGLLACEAAIIGTLLT